MATDTQGISSYVIGTGSHLTSDGVFSIYTRKILSIVMGMFSLMNFNMMTDDAVNDL